MFYEVTALLFTQGLSSKHSGVRAMFNKEFVRTGKVNIEMGRYFARIFEFRQKGDYGDFIDFEKEKVDKWLGDAKEFIIQLEVAIKKELSEL